MLQLVSLYLLIYKISKCLHNLCGRDIHWGHSIGTYTLLILLRSSIWFTSNSCRKISPLILHTLCRAQHPAILTGNFSRLISFLFRRQRNRHFNRLNAPSTTMRVLLRNLLKCIWVLVRLPLSGKPFISQSKKDMQHLQLIKLEHSYSCSLSTGRWKNVLMARVL